MKSYSGLLAKVSVFSGVETTSLERLGKRLKALVMEKEDFIVRQDDPGDAMFIIESGRVKICLHGNNGREVILSIFRSGDFFGEMSLLDGQSRSAHVIALEKTKLLKLSREEFVLHLEEYPATALNVLAEMSLRLRRADEVIGNLTLLDVYGRVAKILGKLAGQEGVPTDEGIMVTSQLTQQELASMINTSRETVSRVLAEFQRRGLLWMQGKKIILSHSFIDSGVGE